MSCFLLAPSRKQGDGIRGIWRSSWSCWREEKVTHHQACPEDTAVGSPGHLDSCLQGLLHTSKALLNSLLQQLHLLLHKPPQATHVQVFSLGTRSQWASNSLNSVLQKRVTSVSFNLQFNQRRLILTVCRRHPQCTDILVFLSMQERTKTLSQLIWGVKSTAYLRK